MIMTTTCILLYDTLNKNISAEGASTVVPFTSHGTKGTVATRTPHIESAKPLTLTGTHTSSVSMVTPESTSVETTTYVSHFSDSMTSYVTFSMPVQTNSVQSTERTTLENTSTCKTNLGNANVKADYPTDCSGFDIKVGLNAVHTIYPFGSPNKTVLVKCVSTCDGIWTVIQRRFDGSLDFYRNWTDYKQGFGDISGEYWLGNDAIHQLTSRSSSMLKVVLKDWDNVTAYAVYDTFQISDESDNYSLTIRGYHGDAGDSLTQHSGEMFSTLDRDNDQKNFSCAVYHTGAWWYHGCFQSNLNGRYFKERTFSEVGIIWSKFRTGLSLKEATMMIQKL